MGQPPTPLHLMCACELSTPMLSMRAPHPAPAISAGAAKLGRGTGSPRGPPVLQEEHLRELSLRQSLGGLASGLIGYHGIVLGDGVAFLIMDEGAGTLLGLYHDR